MRRIVVFDNVTADGYFADSKGSLDWVIPSDEVFRGAAESNQDIDTMLFGRRTYDMFERFWPHALDDQSRDGGLDQRDEQDRVLADP